MFEGIGVADNIHSFFRVKEGTGAPIVVWESFKAFIRGVLISYKNYRAQNHKRALDDLKAQITRLEQEHKLQRTLLSLQSLEVKKNQMRLLEVAAPF